MSYFGYINTIIAAKMFSLYRWGIFYNILRKSNTYPGFSNLPRESQITTFCYYHYMGSFFSLYIITHYAPQRFHFSPKLMYSCHFYLLHEHVRKRILYILFIFNSEIQYCSSHTAYCIINILLKYHLHSPSIVVYFKNVASHFFLHTVDYIRYVECLLFTAKLFCF